VSTRPRPALLSLVGAGKRVLLAGKAVVRMTSPRDSDLTRERIAVATCQARTVCSRCGRGRGRGRGRGTCSERRRIDDGKWARRLPCRGGVWRNCGRGRRRPCAAPCTPEGLWKIRR